MGCSHFVTLQVDSRLIQLGDSFLVLPGGERYIEEAKKKGATILELPNARKFWSSYVKSLYPLQPEVCVAVTGTNGKTSVVSMLKQLWDRLGYKACSLGTLGLNGYAYSEPLNALTTLDSLGLYKLLNHLSSHTTHLAMEASSHGLDQYRLHDIEFSATCFTNLTQDHLDYHASMEDYFRAKERLFTEISSKASVVNNDDDYGKRLRSTLTYGLNSSSDLTLCYHNQTIQITYLGKTYTPVPTSFHVPFQWYNLLAVIGICLVMGISFEELSPHIEHLKSAPGRLEYVATHNGASVFVDYAHTPDALQNVLKGMRCNNKLWVILGCGGNRDALKRPLMGKIACDFADYVVITDDNPRFEEPEKIRESIIAGCSRDVYSIEGRSEAIAFALNQLQPGDILVIAGKGHENTQSIQGIAYPFSDQETVRRLTTCLS